MPALGGPIHIPSHQLEVQMLLKLSWMWMFKGFESNAPANILQPAESVGAYGTEGDWFPNNYKPLSRSSHSSIEELEEGESQMVAIDAAHTHTP